MPDFLERSIFLSESPTDFYPIWPPYAEDPYFIYHNEPGLYFFMRGEQAELKTYPITRDHFAPKSRNVEGGKLYKIYATSKEQLLSLGLSGAIGFSYLMRKELKMTASLPKVSIEDINGIVLDQEIYNILPKSKLITITVPYDGKVVYRRNGKITAINLITSDQRLTVDRISYGTEVQIFQGCDCIRKIRFEEEKYGCDKLNADIELARRLKACTGVLVQIPHSMASVAAEFSDFPETRQWISSMIKQGEMPRTAFNILRNYIL